MSKIVIDNNGCWVWKGSVFKKTNGSYGQLRINGKLKFAHRISYEFFIGQVKDKLELDHLCRNTLCVNPKHLEAVTHRENVIRGKRFNHSNKCKRGHDYVGTNRICKLCKKITFDIWYNKKKKIRSTREVVCAKRANTIGDFFAE